MDISDLVLSCGMEWVSGAWLFTWLWLWHTAKQIQETLQLWDVWPTSGAPLKWVSTVAATAPFGLHPGPGRFYVPRSSLFLGPGHPRCSATLWHRLGSGCLLGSALGAWQGGEHGKVVMRNLAASTEDLCLPQLGVSRHPCTPQEWSPGFSAFLSSVSAILQPVCVAPHDWDAPSVAWPTHSLGWGSTYAISLFLWVPLLELDHFSSHPTLLHVYLC